MALRSGAGGIGNAAELAYRAGVHYLVCGTWHFSSLCVPGLLNTVRPGSFKSAALYILAFDPVFKTLNVTSTVDAFGPHQYLAFNRDRNRIYATTWADPPILSAWAVERETGASTQAEPTLRHLGNAPISESVSRHILPADAIPAATSSYISVQGNKIFSAGGHTAEVHAVSEDGGFGEKLQELPFLPRSELSTADKTRKALVRSAALPMAALG